jgi:hypothetical protein
VLSWRTKLEKLECLKCAGSSVCEKAKGSATTKLLLSRPHAMTASVDGLSTMRYVLATNGATPAASTLAMAGRKKTVARPLASCYLIDHAVPPVNTTTGRREGGQRVVVGLDGCIYTRRRRRRG